MNYFFLALKLQERRYALWVTAMNIYIIIIIMHDGCMVLATFTHTFHITRSASAINMANVNTELHVTGAGVKGKL